MECLIRSWKIEDATDFAAALNIQTLLYFAEPFAYNIPSCRILEKAGFTCEGTLRNNAYTSKDVKLLLDALGGYGEYFLISSSAVYLENTILPFKEDMLVGVNKYWGKYGTDKI